MKNPFKPRIEQPYEFEIPMPTAEHTWLQGHVPPEKMPPVPAYKFKGVKQRNWLVSQLIHIKGWVHTKISKKPSLKDKADSLAQALVNNLNQNVMIDHVSFVEHGVRPLDDDYYTFKKKLTKKLGKKELASRLKDIEDKAIPEYRNNRIKIPNKN